MANNVLIEVDLDEKKIDKSFKSISNKSGKSGKRISASFSKVFSGLSGQILALGSVLATAFAGRAIIQAAARQEDSIQKLSTSLATAGTLSVEATDKILELSVSIQATTATSDDLFISMVALSQSYTQTAEAATELTAAALDFATGAGITFEEAVRRLGRGVQGSTGDIANFAPEIRNLTRAQLSAGEATRILGERFSGAAAANVNTFSGRIAQLQNVFGGLLEEIGSFITRSPGLIAAIGFISKEIFEVSDAVKSVRGETSSFFDSFLSGAATFAAGVTALVIAPLEAILSVVSLVFNAIRLTIIGAVSGTANLLSGLVNLVAPESSLGVALNGFSERYTNLFASVKGGVEETLKELTPVANTFAEKLGELKGIVDSANLTKPLRDDLTRTKEEAAITFGEIIDIFALTATNLQEFGSQFGTTTADVIKNFKQIRNAAFTNIVRGVGGAFAAFGSALAKGENAFEAFTKALISSVGQAAIALGTEFILRGTAYLFVPGLTQLGVPLIAAGAALATFGGVLSAVGGGGGGGGASASASGAGQAGPGPAEDFGGLDLAEEDQPEFDKTTQVAVTIQGDVLDTRETGLRIVDILNESFDSEGTRLVTA